jgi:hypothetical protein
MALLQKAYLGATPLFRQQDWFEDGTAKPVSIGTTTATADAAAHTKGAFSQVIASTAANSSVFVVNVTGIVSSGSNTATLLDIATGASGSESVILENIAVGGASNPSQGGITFTVPFKIASGTRLSARIQSVITGGKTADIEIQTFDAGNYDTAPTSADVVGANTANSQGVSFSGASGSWTQATASTTRAYRALVFVPSTHDNAISNLTANFEIGVGASGSEQTVGASRAVYNSSEACYSNAPYFSLFGFSFASGIRLAVKHDLSSNQARYGFTLIGLP